MENDVYKLLKNLNIEFEIVEHPPLFTCKDNDKYNINIDAVICKNLFIRNSNKSNYYLFVLPLTKRINLKLLQEILNESRLSFGDENTLYDKLKATPGSVSIFNFINVENTDIKIIIDEEILKCEKVAFHPNINTLTVVFNSNKLKNILDYYDINYSFIKM